ncbi:MAG: hypothetical protein AAGK97_01280 [Bacteroidota bacterium]
MSRYFKYLFFVLICTFTFSLNAQINIKVGYSLGFLNSDVNDAIVNKFNERN